MTFHMIVILFLCVSCILSMGSKGKGSVKRVLLPHDPEVMEGGAINLTCTLHGVVDNVTSNSLFLKYPNDLKFTKHVIVYNDTSAQFVLTNITTSDNYLGVALLTIGCYYRHNGRDDLVEQQRITVYGHPKISDVSCIMYYKYGVNETLNCTWTDHTLLGHDWTDELEFTWKQQYLSKAYKNCSRLIQVGERFSCVWTTEKGPNRFIPSLGLQLKYVATLIRDQFRHNITRHLYINTSEIVKPFPIEKFKVSDRTSSWLNITWDFPSGKYYIDVVYYNKLVYVYRINATSAHFDDVSVTVFNTSHATLPGLHPAETYTVSMEIKPHVKGFWSEPTYMKNVIMKEAAPSRPPVITDGSWWQYSGADNNGQRTIKFFWQDIVKSHQNGDILRYNLTVEPTLGSNPDVKPVSSEQHEAEISGLVDGTSYTVSIQGENAAGLSPAASWSIKASGLEPPDLTLVLRNSTVEFSWPTAQADNVTVYWYRCTQDSCQQAKWGWSVLQGNRTSFCYHIGSSLLLPQYTFAISAENNGVSSGMKQTSGKCVFHHGAVPVLTPADVKVDSIEHDRASLVWQIPPCTDLKAQVTVVIVQYAKSSSNCEDLDGDPQREILGASEERFTFLQLEPKTDYCFQVALQSPGGAGNFSAFVLATTVSDPTQDMIIASTVSGTFVLLVILLIIVRYARKGHHFWFRQILFDSSMVPNVEITQTRRSESYTDDTIYMSAISESCKEHKVSQDSNEKIIVKGHFKDFSDMHDNLEKSHHNDKLHSYMNIRKMSHSSSVDDEDITPNMTQESSGNLVDAPSEHPTSTESYGTSHAKPPGTSQDGYLQPICKSNGDHDFVHGPQPTSTSDYLVASTYLEPTSRKDYTSTPITQITPSGDLIHNLQPTAPNPQVTSDRDCVNMAPISQPSSNGDYIMASGSTQSTSNGDYVMTSSIPQPTFNEDYVMAPIPQSVSIDDYVMAPIAQSKSNGDYVMAPSTQSIFASTLTEYCISTPTPRNASNGDYVMAPIEQSTSNGDCVKCGHDMSPIQNSTLTEDSISTPIPQSASNKDYVMAHIAQSTFNGDYILASGHDMCPIPNSTLTEDCISTPTPRNASNEDYIMAPIPQSTSNGDYVMALSTQSVLASGHDMCPISNYALTEDCISIPTPHNASNEDYVIAPIPQSNIDYNLSPSTQLVSNWDYVAAPIMLDTSNMISTHISQPTPTNSIESPTNQNCVSDPFPNNSPKTRSRARPDVSLPGPTTNRLESLDSSGYGSDMLSPIGSDCPLIRSPITPTMHGYITLTQALCDDSGFKESLL